MTPDPALLAAIRADPDDGARWLALAGWFRDDGRDDESAAVRVFWLALRDSPAAGRSIDLVLADVGRNAGLLGASAREIEGRGRGVKDRDGPTSDEHPDRGPDAAGSPRPQVFRSSRISVSSRHPTARCART